MDQELSIFMKRITGDVSTVAGWLWQRGWAERNAGNISVRLAEDEIASFPDEQPVLLPLPKRFETLPGVHFLVTATNTRMRDVAARPLETLLIIRISDDGRGYRILSPPGETALRPTSEIQAHLCIHEMLSQKRPAHRVVMHTHVTELIALTQIREFCDEQRLNSILLGMHPETKVFVPDGVGFVPYILPGTRAIGDATVKALEDHSAALWEKHGLFATGRDPLETFDMIDILAKSASIWFMCRSAGYNPEGLTEMQLNELAKLKF
jgi:rhamnulose-1-phosphate aldolase